MRKITFILFSLFAFFTVSQAQPPAGAKDPVAIFLEEAEKARRAGDFKKAIAEYDHALIIRDTLTEIHFRKGLCFFQLKDTASGVTALEKALTVNPRFTPAMQVLMKTFSETKNNDGLIRLFDRMSKAETELPRKLEFKMRIVRMLADVPDYKTMTLHTEEALKIDPTNLEASYFHAKANNALGKFDVAKTTMEKATASTDSNDPKVTARLYYELGYAYYKLGDFTKSTEAFEKAKFGPFIPLVEKLTPNYYYNIANAHLQVYSFEEATKALNTVLQMDKNHPQANVMLAEIHNRIDLAAPGKADKREKEVLHYRQAIKGEKDEKRLIMHYERLMKLLIDSKRYPEAITTADECLGKFATAKAIAFQKATALAKGPKPGDGLSLLLQLTTDPTNTPIENVTYNFAVGLLYKTTKDYERAREAFLKSKNGPFSNGSQYELDQLDDLEAAAGKKKAQ